MKKGINLQAKLHVGSDPNSGADLENKLPALFGNTNEGLTLTIKHASAPDEKGDVTLKVYIEGDQDPASDFAALTHKALKSAIAALNKGTSTGPSLGNTASRGSGGHHAVHIKKVRETEGDEEDSGVVLAPTQQPPANSPTMATTQAPAVLAPQTPTASQPQSQAPVQAPK
ncbi:MAG: hypothetical protein ABIQ44_01090 [Chloroflexia bacterium]